MNTSLFNLIHNLTYKWWLLDWLGIFLAKYLGYVLILIALLLLIKEKNWRQRIYFFSLMTLSVILARGIITEIIRFFYSYPRPFQTLSIQPLIAHSPDNSFPSGHTAAFFALALVIFYFCRQKKQSEDQTSFNNLRLGWWVLIMATLIGISRIFVGIHWPLDILAGALIGLTSAFLIKKLLPTFEIK